MASTSTTTSISRPVENLRDNNEVEVSGGIFARADASLIGLAGISIKGGITATPRST